VNIGLIIIKMFEEEMNNPLKGEREKRPTKKNKNPYGNAIVNFDVAKFFSKRII
jgi:hypothetical protein